MFTDTIKDLGISSLCNAYLHDADATEFVNFTDASKRLYKNEKQVTDGNSGSTDDSNEDADPCRTNTYSKYFLYHITNLDDVVNKSAIPIVEKRGPWVFRKEKRDYVLKFDKERSTNTYSSRSWHVIDDEETSKLCAECSTINLCASWPEPSNVYDFPTNCTKGTLVGELEYNKVTVPNVAYLQTLEVLEDLGVNEHFILYTLASKALNKFYKSSPPVTVPSATSSLPSPSIEYDYYGNPFDQLLFADGEKLLLAEIGNSIKTMRQIYYSDINSQNPTNSFEYHFRNKTFPNVPPLKPGSDETFRRVNYNLLNMPATVPILAGNGQAPTDGARISKSAYDKMFDENGQLRSTSTNDLYDVSLLTVEGLDFWLNVANEDGNLCQNFGGQTTIEVLFSGTDKVPKEELCAIHSMVKNMYEEILKATGAKTPKDLPGIQWSQSKLLGGYYLNNLTSFEFELCPYGTSMYDVAPYNTSLKQYGPPELACFLKMYPQQHHAHHSAYTEPSTLLPRSINASDLAKWTPLKSKKWFWFISGANVSDGSENVLNESTPENGYDGRAKYLNLNVGWGGLATASLNEGYQSIVNNHLANFISYPATPINIKEDISTYFFKSAGSAIKLLLNNSFPRGANILYAETSKNIKYVYDAVGSDFETRFNTRSILSVPPTGAQNTPKINHNLLNIPSSTSLGTTTNFEPTSDTDWQTSYGLLFGAGAAGQKTKSGTTYTLSLIQEEGVKYWLNQVDLVCAGNAGDAFIDDLLNDFDATQLCAIGQMVKNVHNAISGASSVEDIAAMQWAASEFYGASLRNGTNTTLCPRGASMADVEPYKQNLVTPPELSCFVELYPPSSSKVELATLVPRSLNGTDLIGWNSAKAKKYFHFLSGLNVADGSVFTNLSPKYDGVSIGWSGLSVAALNNAYFNLTETDHNGVEGIPSSVLGDRREVLSTSSTYASPYSTLDEKCGMTFLKKLEEANHHSTTITAFTGTNNMITCRELQTLVSYTLYIDEWVGLTTSCTSAFSDALVKTGYFASDTKADQFIKQLDFTCKELQTLSSYTNYIADTFVWKPHVLKPRCTHNQTIANYVCEKCKNYKGCKTVNEPLLFPSNLARDSTSSFEEYIHKELCYLPNSNVLNSSCLNYKQTGYLNCSDIDPTYCSTFKKCPHGERSDNIYGDKGGLFVTLNSSSLFNGWSDPLLDQFEEMGVDLGIPSYGRGILVNADDSGLAANRDNTDVGVINSPYHNAEARHDSKCWETAAFKDSLLEDGIRPTSTNYVERLCDGSTYIDALRAENYRGLSSVEKQKQPYEKPCHYKNSTYLRTSYYGKNKLFQLYKIHNFETVKGIINREDATNTFFDPNADTWGELVNVEGYDGSQFPPALSMNEEKKTYEEIQSEEKKERAEKIINENKDTVFPSYYKVWNDFVSRPLIYRYNELVESDMLSGTYKVRARRFLPIDLLTRFTANENSSDAMGGEVENPYCLINLKKVTNIPLYFGHPDFHTCPAENLIEVTNTNGKNILNNLTNTIASFFNDTSLIGSLNHDYNDVNFLANITTLYRSKIINPSNKGGKLQYSDLPYIDVEPVTGIAIEQKNKISLYTRVRKTRVFSRNVTRSVIPYFQSEAIEAAKPDQLEALYKSLDIIKSNAETYRSLQIVVLILGIILLIASICICAYACKYKRDNAAGNGPSTPKANPLAAKTKDYEMAGMKVRKTMKVVNGTEVKMEGYKGAKLEAIKPPARSAKTPRGFRAGHVFDDDDDDLPPGWVSIKDKESGDYYYYNAAANVTQWDKPVVKPPPRKIQPPPRTAKTPKGFRQGAFQKSYKDLKKKSVLPPGWEECNDDGDIYFYNSETGESQWDMPKLVQAPARNEQSKRGFRSRGNEFSKSFRDLKKTQQLAPGWEAIVEAESGDTYYFNKDTGETTWDEPKPIQAPPRTAKTPKGFRKGNDFSKSFHDLKKSATLPGDWEAIVEAESGDTYYFNKDTGETTWDEPKPIQAPPRTAKTPKGFRKGNDFSKSFHDLKKSATLPGDWEAIVEAESGDTYYFNKDTGETTWDEPKPIQAPPRTAKTPKGFRKGNDFAQSFKDLKQQSKLLPNWEMLLDESGDAYFWNSVTNETQWEEPLQ
eukprot:g2502.t1